MTWIDNAVRVVAAGAAFAAFYVAWFVYEDEEKNLQNKIETWWLQFEDFRSHLMSRQAAFVVVVALRANEVLDRLFGPKLLSKDAIAVATSLTLGSYFLAAPFFFIGRVPGGAIPWIGGAAGIALLACAFAPLVTPRLRRLPRFIMWLLVVYSLLALLTVGLDNDRFFLALTAIPVLGQPAGIALTMCQIVVVRHAMRSTIAAKSEWPIVAGMVIIAVPIGVLSMITYLPSYSLAHDMAYEALRISAFVVGCGCFIVGALGGLLAAVASLMLLHRLVWPLASRVLYALGRYRVVQNKAALNTIGATLTGIAISGTYGWQALLRHFGSA